jgi:hypothetical protein
MRQTNRLGLALAAAASFAALSIAVTACGGGGDEEAFEPTAKPFYTCRDPYPTYSPGSDLPTLENFPVPDTTTQPTVTASGLQIYDELAGAGDAAQADGIVYINFTQWVQGGNQCERTHVGPVRYRLTKGQLIDGLIEGLIGMKIGGHRVLIIPPELAFGSAGSGNVIPPNATLIYDIEMTTAAGQTTPTPLPASEATATAVP